VIVDIRSAMPPDFGYIVHSMKREIDRYLAQREKPAIAPVLTPVIDAFVRGAQVAVVACDRDEPSTLVGWAIWNQNTLVYVYVAAAVRGQRVGRKLIDHGQPRVEVPCAS
jgi:GNAT superfamily N-acetyltransferase